MIDRSGIMAALTDVDGTCRDINFEGYSWEGVEGLLSYLVECSNSAPALDGQGRQMDPIPGSLVEAARKTGCVHLSLGEPCELIGHLQVFIATNEDKSPFVELTFFPEDIETTESLEGDFIEWLDSVQLRLGAQRYYVRYENASWQTGDTSPSSGVFLVSDEVATND